MTPGVRIVDPSREPTFDILPDGKIVEVGDGQPHGAPCTRSRAADAVLQQKPIFFFFHFFFLFGTVAAAAELKKSHSFFKKKKVRARQTRRDRGADLAAAAHRARLTTL